MLWMLSIAFATELLLSMLFSYFLLADLQGSEWPTGGDGSAVKPTIAKGRRQRDRETSLSVTHDSSLPSGGI